jgi:NDP-sugar pyrophosphorylase family protein
MTKFQLVIPMSGIGKRFKDAGYKELKPFIMVNGKPIIEHILDMYPIDSMVLIIMNEDDPELTSHIEYVHRMRPLVKVKTISSHKKGPGYAIWEAREDIDATLPVIVNYADFSGTWDFAAFLNQLSKYDGSILTYTGFHPHMIRSNKFAYVKLNNANFVTDIQEKLPYTSDPMQEHASSGVYGFSSGRVLLESVRKQIEDDLSLNGEYYISLTYKPMISSGMRVSIQDMVTFNQWGTPEDLQDWTYWNSVVQKATSAIALKDQKAEDNAILLAAGRGTRVTAVAKTEKPFIKIGDSYLWERALNDGKEHSEVVLVTREVLKDRFPAEKFSSIVSTKEITSGQAASALSGLLRLRDKESPVTIFSCDNVLNGELKSDFNQQDETIVVWVSQNYPPSKLHPEQYSWVTVDADQCIDSIYLKKSPPDLDKAFLIIGNFTFSSALLAIQKCESIIVKNIQLNGEHYLDSIIQEELALGHKVSVRLVPNFIAIGNETEYETFKYYAKK